MDICNGCKYETDEWHDDIIGPCETCWHGVDGVLYAENYEPKK